MGQVNTRVINVRSGEKPEVYIGRPGFWGNPFVIGVGGDREEVLRKYEKWLHLVYENGTYTKEKLLSLRGKTLGCWCSPKPCHGDILAAFIEEVANEDAG